MERDLTCRKVIEGMEMSRIESKVRSNVLLKRGKMFGEALRV